MQMEAYFTDWEQVARAVFFDKGCTLWALLCCRFSQYGPPACRQKSRRAKFVAAKYNKAIFLSALVLFALFFCLLSFRL